MKKTTKTAKPPAPAAKSVAPTPAPKPAAAPAPASQPVAPALAPKSVATPRIKKPDTAAASKPASGSNGSKPVTIIANVDVGFGNTLFVRGDGAGLNWDKGIPLACVSDTTWTITLTEVAKPVAFKLLVNDQNWSEGGDAIAAPGDRVTLAPVF